MGRVPSASRGSGACAASPRANARAIPPAATARAVSEETATAPAPNRSVAVAARARRVARERRGAIDASVDTARGGVALGREEGCALGAGNVHPQGIHGVARRGNARRRVRGVGECDGMLQRCYLARSRVREKVGLAGPPRLGPAVRTVRRRKSDRQKVDAWTRPFRVSSSEKNLRWIDCSGFPHITRHLRDHPHSHAPRRSPRKQRHASSSRPPRLVRTHLCTRRRASRSFTRAVVTVLRD